MGCCIITAFIDDCFLIGLYCSAGDAEKQLIRDRVRMPEASPGFGGLPPKDGIGGSNRSAREHQWEFAPLNVSIKHAEVATFGHGSIHV